MSSWPRSEFAQKWLSRAARLLTRYRRPVAAALMALAVGLTLTALRPGSPAQSSVVIATHDLSAGAVVAPGDVTVSHVLSGAQPDGATADPAVLVGHRLIGPVRRGEVLTDVRFVDSGTLADAAGAGRVAVPVRLSDGEVATLLTAGVVVDIVAADGQGAAEVVAAGARVIAVPDSSGEFFDGALVLVSMTPSEATTVAAAAAIGPLSVTLRG